MLRLSLVCSGITQSARANGFPGDGPLEERSIRLAARVSRRLTRPASVFASPCIQARETTALLGLDSVENEMLRDQDFGAWAGRTFADVHAEEPEKISEWMSNPSFAPPGGESLSIVANRMESFLDTASQLSGHAIAVTHGIVVRTAIGFVLGAPLAAVWRIDAPPLAITDISHDGRRWTLRSLSPTTLDEQES